MLCVSRLKGWSVHKVVRVLYGKYSTVMKLICYCFYSTAHSRRSYLHFCILPALPNSYWAIWMSCIGGWKNQVSQSLECLLSIMTTILYISLCQVQLLILPWGMGWWAGGEGRWLPLAEHFHALVSLLLPLWVYNPIIKFLWSFQFISNGYAINLGFKYNYGPCLTLHIL